MALLLTMVGVPARATTWSPERSVSSGSTKVGYGNAGVDQLYWRTSGNQWASWSLTEYRTSADTRGVYGSFYARHTELLSHPMPGGGDVWSRVPVGKTIETARVALVGNVTTVKPVTGYSYSTNIYGPADLLVQVKVCLDVKRWFDTCADTFTIQNAVFKG